MITFCITKNNNTTFVVESEINEYLYSHSIRILWFFKLCNLLIVKVIKNNVRVP